jgi:hypothetical protein
MDLFFRCKDSYFVVNRWSIQKFPIFVGGLVYIGNKDVHGKDDRREK